MSSKSGLTSTDICEIIRSCGENSVYTLTFGDLKLEFGPKQETVEYVPVDTLETVEELEHNEEDTKESAERLADMMEELKLTNPVAYDEIQLNGEILNE